MAFSYSGDPSNSDKDKVRFLLGDTNKDAPLLQDGEIAFLITSQNTVIEAAVAGAQAIAAQFARLTDESVGDISKSYSQRVEHYRQLASDLRRRANVAVAPYAGGISKDDKTNAEADTDRVQPRFTRDLHDNPRRHNSDDNHND